GTSHLYKLARRPVGVRTIGVCRDQSGRLHFAGQQPNDKTSPRGAGCKSRPAVRAREPSPRGWLIRWNSGADGESPDRSEGARAPPRAPCPPPNRATNGACVDDSEAMQRAIGLAEGVRGTTSPNPWVGCVIESVDGQVFEGATSPAGGPHAEAQALAAAGDAAQGATLWATLEACMHHGRTPPCTDAIIAAGIRRVVVAIVDPDRQVFGGGIDVLGDAGIEVVVGVHAEDVRRQLAPYIKHRETGRPWVVL